MQGSVGPEDHEVFIWTTHQAHHLPLEDLVDGAN